MWNDTSFIFICISLTVSDVEHFFIIWDWNAKVGSQEIPGVTANLALLQSKAGQRLTEFCQENVLVIANYLFQQHKRRLYTWTSPDGQYQYQTGYIICSWRWRSSIHSAKIKIRSWLWLRSWTPIDKFRFKLKKVGKTTRRFRYDLNKIPYNGKVKWK